MPKILEKSQSGKPIHLSATGTELPDLGRAFGFVLGFSRLPSWTSKSLIQKERVD